MAARSSRQHCASSVQSRPAHRSSWPSLPSRCRCSDGAEGEWTGTDYRSNPKYALTCRRRAPLARARGGRRRRARRQASAYRLAGLGRRVLARASRSPGAPRSIQPVSRRRHVPPICQLIVRPGDSLVSTCNQPRAGSTKREHMLSSVSTSLLWLARRPDPGSFVTLGCKATSSGSRHAGAAPRSPPRRGRSPSTRGAYGSKRSR